MPRTQSPDKVAILVLMDSNAGMPIDTAVTEKRAATSTQSALKRD